MKSTIPAAFTTTQQEDGSVHIEYKSGMKNPGAYAALVPILAVATLLVAMFLSATINVLTNAGDMSWGG